MPKGIPIRGWQKEWPKEEGFYWLYGKHFYHSEPFIALIQVRKVISGLDYYTGTGYIQPGELFSTLWARTEPPDGLKSKLPL